MIGYKKGRGKATFAFEVDEVGFCDDEAAVLLPVEVVELLDFEGEHDGFYLTWR
jgi:hypothetical protein